MTEICEAYPRRGMDAATPIGVVGGPVCPVQGWSWQLRTLAITGFWSPCVPVCNADTQGEGGYIYTDPCQFRATLYLSQSHSICRDT